MKKSLLCSLGALLLVLSLLCSGCQVCADCQCQTYSTQPGADPVTSEFEVCGRDDIRDTRGVSKQTVTVGGKTYTSTTDCDCRYK